MPEAESVDTLVVGGRCAGSPLALTLARAGQNVLMVDQAQLPSDQPISTHFIQPYGMAILDELGLGEAVRAVAPPIPAILNGVGDAVARICLLEGRTATCPRRTDLDELLLNAAKDAGVRVSTGVRLVELLWDQGRVVGGVLDERGEKREVRANIVVGADGPRSTVAQSTKAEEYYAYDAPNAGYWAYWPRPDDYATREEYGGASAILHRGDEYYIVFPVNRDQILVGLIFPIAGLPKWRGRHKEELLKRLRAFPFTAALTQGEPLTEVRGLVKARFFFRQATGPGWALVGDAGLFKDPAPGLGISDALRDSQALAQAILEGSDRALERYWRQRDVNSLDLFEFARDFGSPGYDNPLNRVIFSKLRKHKALQDRIFKVFTRELPPSQAFTTGEVVRWTAGAMLKGQWGAFKPFLKAGARAEWLKRELKVRTDLLDALS